MGKVTVDITMSLDGLIAGANDGPDLPLGEGGERLHEWLFGLASWRERHGLAGGERGRDAEIMDEAFRDVGAIVLGRRMYDNAHGWGDEPPFGVPVFVLTHHASQVLAKQGGKTFTFVTGGIEAALDQAKAVAGGRDVSIAGGANTIQQFLSAGFVDEIQVHVAPLLLGAGIRLFDNLGSGPVELERTRLVESADVTHIKFRVNK
jgi:dihydrofolate reductase